MDNSIGNGPCTLINFMPTLQVSSVCEKKKRRFFLGSLHLTTYEIHTEDAGKVFYTGLQDPCQLGKEGKNLISLQRKRFSILMR
jgi:hypothetical protein